MAINRHIQHIKSQVVENGAPKLPTSDQIQLGEIAINYAKGYETIAVKNSSGDIVTFTSDNYWVKKEETVAASLNDLDDRINELSEETSANIEELEETLTSAVDDLDSRKAEKVALADLAEDVRVLTETVTKLDGPDVSVEELEETLTSAVDDLDSRKAEKVALTDLAEDVRVITETVTGFDNQIEDLSGQSETIAVALNDLDDNKIGKTINTTWSELKALRDGGNLVEGQWYRITDYVTTTTQTNTQSANHAFDVIVRADSSSVLNENAYAALHEGDSYFANCKINAWELKYTIDNIYWSEIKGEFCDVYISSTNYTNLPCMGTEVISGTTYYKLDFRGKIADLGSYLYTTSLSASASVYAYIYNQYWANVGYVTDTSIRDTEGTGTITYLKDEYDNECPYDFKNIQFKRYKVTATTTPATNLVNGYVAVNTTMNGFTVDSSSWVWRYTFDYNPLTSSSAAIDASLLGSDYNNRITSIIGKLNNIVLSVNCNNNTFGTDCTSNTFGTGCTSNTFGTSCTDNTFADGCTSNTFGSSCYSNTFDNGCQCNTFGSSCTRNTFGSSCYSNTFDNTCQYNTFGSSCTRNTFGSSCQHITFNKNYCYYNIIESGNKYITLTSTQTTSSSNYLQNITIAQGVNNTTTQKTISHNTVNDTFKTTYQSANSQIINV